MNRRGFLRELAKRTAATPLVVAAPLALVAGCDDEEAGQSGGGGQGGGACNSTSATISSNHGHSLSVPVADVQAGAAQRYNIQGSSAHPHTVQLSANLMVNLRESGMVTVTSSSDSGHSHSVTIRCA